MKKILIVEDEIAYQELLYEQLTLEGYDVMKANNGKVGLRLAKQLRPDLILSDIRMPIMDGLTMVRELRKDTYGKSANVILLTNLEQNDDMQYRLSEANPRHYILKSDIDIFDLLDKIKACV